jgi:hypothetical protein
MRLSDLMHDARRFAEWRGHDMSEFDEFMISACRRCGLTAFVDEYPGPAGIKLGGSALAVECNSDDEPAHIHSTKEG